METQQKSKVLKWSLIIGITIVLNMFFNYALSVVYHSPEWEDFCKNEQVIEPIDTKEQCIAIGGQWNGNVKEQYTKPAYDIGEPLSAKGFCNQNYICQMDYESAQNVYDRNVFISLVILGVITLGVSTVITNIAVSQGLSLGGVLSFVIASMRYWGRADDLVKVCILAIALAVLVYLAYKKFGNSVK